MYYEAILLAAGQGKRMGASNNKILLHLLGKPVIIYALEAFLQDQACGHIVLVVQADEKELIQRLLKQHIKHANCPITIVIGGKERQDSVHHGLLAMKRADSYVMVHDGARPFLSLVLLKRLYQTVTEHQTAILGVPVKDTIKLVEEGQVKKTIPREGLWQIQTPQAFVGTELLSAHKQAIEDHFLGTDDASLIEKYSQREVQIVLGNYENIKLTTPDDMLIGEAILRRNKRIL